MLCATASRKPKRLTGSVVAGPLCCFSSATRASGSPRLSSPPATLQKWRATGQSRRRRSISPGAGQPSFGLVRLSAYASGHRACRTCVPCPPRQGGRVRVAAECPRPRKSRSARCGVSTDQRFSSACDREPPADTALQTRTWRRAGRLPSPVASSAFDSARVRAGRGSAERDAVHFARSTEQREARGLVAPLSPEQTRGGPRGVGRGRCGSHTPQAAQLATASAVAGGADAWLPRPRTARPDLNTNDTTVMRD
jgi:hypothetical protein